MFLALRILRRYCSEECGRRLARHRLYQILPGRIQEWNSTPTIASEQGKKELERIRVRMEQARNELNALGMLVQCCTGKQGLQFIEIQNVCSEHGDEKARQCAIGWSEFYLIFWIGI